MKKKISILFIKRLWSIKYVVLVKIIFRRTAFCWSTKRKFLSVRTIVKKIETSTSTFVKDRCTNLIRQIYYLLPVVYTAVSSRDRSTLENLIIIKIVIIQIRWSAECLRFDFRTIELFIIPIVKTKFLTLLNNT